MIRQSRTPTVRHLPAGDSTTRAHYAPRSRSVTRAPYRGVGDGPRWIDSMLTKHVESRRSGRRGTAHGVFGYVCHQRSRLWVSSRRLRSGARASIASASGWGRHEGSVFCPKLHGSADSRTYRPRLARYCLLSSSGEFRRQTQANEGARLACGAVRASECCCPRARRVRSTRRSTKANPLEGYRYLTRSGGLTHPRTSSSSPFRAEGHARRRFRTVCWRRCVTSR